VTNNSETHDQDSLYEAAITLPWSARQSRERVFSRSATVSSTTQFPRKAPELTGTSLQAFHRAGRMPPLSY
jgi:hypothetical protein